MAEISELLKLYQDRRRASVNVKKIALAHVADLNRRMEEMAAMKRTLERRDHRDPEVHRQPRQGMSMESCPEFSTVARKDLQ